jgi:hypothetical protein
MAKLYLLVACFALSGCDYVFRIDRIKEDPAVPGVDAGGFCTGAVIDDSFDDGNACSPWGIPYENAGGTLLEGVTGLTIVPANAGTSGGGCITSQPVPFRGGGIAVEVSSVLSGRDSEYTQLQLFGEVRASIGTLNEELVVFDQVASTTVSAVPYDPISMRWWKIRPETSSNELVAETSPDGVTWMPAGKIARMPIPEVTDLNLIAGLGEMQTEYDNPAIFRRLVVCP